jgi:carboxymethylenebutenolidase
MVKPQQRHLRIPNGLQKSVIAGAGTAACGLLSGRKLKQADGPQATRRSVMAQQMIEFPRPDGKTIAGYYVEPAAGVHAPGMVVIQEWWGLNAQIKGVAERFAGAGFRVLVPDLFRGTVTVDAKEAEHLMTGLDFGDAAGQDLRGAVAYLKRTSAKVGVNGFCMGGALSLLVAANVPAADAVTAWYGYPPLEYLDATKIKAPLLCHFGTEDAFFPIAGVDALEDKLRAAGVSHEVHRYRAKHAFGNETAIDAPIPIRYDASAAALAWERTMAFFARLH